MSEPNFEKRLAQAARSLASHLTEWARHRREEDKKAISVSEMEICRIWREEQTSGKSGKR